MNLILPNAIPRKWRANRNAKRMIKGFNLKDSPFRRDPIDFVPIALSQPERIQEIKKAK
jgi:hypothetical protein